MSEWERLDGEFRVEILRRVNSSGPDRVVFNEVGYTAPSPRFREMFPDLPVIVVYIRDDGWTVGAPAGLEEVARGLWPDEWVAVLRAPGWEVEIP